MAEETLKVNIDGKDYKVKVIRRGSKLTLKVDGAEYSLLLDRNENNHYIIYFKNKIFPITVRRIENGSLEIGLHGTIHEARVERIRSLPVSVKRVFKRSKYTIKTPISGKIVSIPVRENQLVEEGQTLVVIEAMKMRNEIKSPRRGILTKLNVLPGQLVEKNTVLAELQLS